MRKPKKRTEDAIKKGIVREAAAWALRCGMHEPLHTSGVKRLEYGNGHGFTVTVQEEAGKRRKATAKFTSEGRPSMWTMDGTLIF